MSKWLGDADIYNKRGPRTQVDFVNQRFGKLVAHSAANHDKNGRLLVLFNCDCGVQVIRRLDNVMSGSIKSCGCLRLNKGKNGQAKAYVRRHLYDLYPSPTHRVKK
jgi:hypothetical protein